MQLPKAIFAGIAVSESAIEPDDPSHPADAYRLLADGAFGYAAITLTPAGIVASWNVGAERLSGYHGDEIVGRHVSVLYPPEERHAGVAEQVLVAALERGSAAVEGWRVRSDGGRFWAHVVVTSLWDRAGALRGFAKLMRDETARLDADEVRAAAARRGEQERIASELGETLVRQLFGVGLELAAAERLAGESIVSRRIERAREHIDDAIGLLRRGVFDEGADPGGAFGERVLPG